MPAGMTLEQREAARERIRQQALAQAARLGVSLRCQRAMQYAGQDNPLIIAEHQSCRGEDPGGSGCLCTCHDRTIALTAIRGETA